MSRLNDDKNLLRSLSTNEQFLDFCDYLRSVLALPRGHAAAIVCSPAVPIPAATDAQFRALDKALMIGILEANMKKANLSVHQPDHQLRILAACMMICFRVHFCLGSGGRWLFPGSAMVSTVWE